MDERQQPTEEDMAQFAAQEGHDNWSDYQSDH